MFEFCTLFEQIYGKEHCTINIHLHCHLKQCIVDYGPVYSFWLFSFERLNGVLGSYHTNYHDISLQLMRRFLSSHQYASTNWPEEYVNDFSPILLSCFYNKGALNASDTSNLKQSSMDIEIFPPVCECALEQHQKLALHSIAKEVYSYSHKLCYSYSLSQMQTY